MLGDVEAMAEAWSDRVEIVRMVETMTAVFGDVANVELLSRFRQQVSAVIQQAWIEGHITPHARVAELEAENERLRDVAREAKAFLKAAKLPPPIDREKFTVWSRTKRDTRRNLELALAKMGEPR